MVVNKVGVELRCTGLLSCGDGGQEKLLSKIGNRERTFRRDCAKVQRSQVVFSKSLHVLLGAVLVTDADQSPRHLLPYGLAVDDLIDSIDEMPSPMPLLD